jgi:hypothetical protein
VFDFGACSGSWVHGISGNPLVKLAKEAGLKLGPRDGGIDEHIRAFGHDGQVRGLPPLRCSSSASFPACPMQIFRFAAMGRKLPAPPPFPSIWSSFLPLALISLFLAVCAQDTTELQYEIDELFLKLDDLVLEQVSIQIDSVLGISADPCLVDCRARRRAVCCRTASS